MKTLALVGPVNLLVFITCFASCQSSNTTSKPTTPAISDSELSSTKTTTIAPDSSSSLSDVLLSANEFVDFTEAPTLLFDGTSNENSHSNDSQPNSSSRDNNNSTTTLTTTPSPATSKHIDETPTTVEPEANSSISSDSDLADSGVDDEDDDGVNSGSREELRQAFEPPKNVSQYMDYIERLFHDLRHQITDLFEPHIPQLIRTSQMVELSGSCSYDMLRMALALRQFEPWALRMIDSSGKLPEGIFEGSFTALGSYDECLSTVFASAPGGSSASSAAQSSPGESSSSNQAPDNSAATQGKYCLVNVSPFLPPKPPVDRVEREFQEEANRRNYTKDDQFSRLSPMFYYMKFRIGVCIPSTCLDSDMANISNALSSSLRLNITIPHCKVKQSLPITGHQLAGGIVFGLVVSMVIVATLVDCFRRKWNQIEKQDEMIIVQLSSIKANQEPKLDPIKPMLVKSSDASKEIETHWAWLSFSLLNNYKIYFDQQSSRSPSGQTDSRKEEQNSMIIRCLNGIRVISLCWVIVANSYVTLDPRATKRLTKTRDAPKDFLFQVIAQASLAIETFFFLSGVLMSLSFARRFQARDSGSSRDDRSRTATDQNSAAATNRSQQTLKWLHFYLHRYIRMTPATMLVIAFTMFAFRYGDGPIWMEATHKAHLSCAENWWRHLLHVANFIDTRQMCFIHYWYIAADMQLFIFAPLLLFLLYRHRRIGYALVTLIGLLSFGSVFYTTYMRNLPPTLLFYNSDPE